MNPLCIDLYGNNDVFLKISQYDKNYPITIILLNYTYKSGDIVKIDWCMNKETSIVQASNITQIDNTITFKLPREVALDGGEGTFNIVIENPNDDTRKSTFKIRTMIEYDSVNENTVNSILVETIIEDLKKEENNAQNKLNLLNEAIDKADLGKHNLISYTDLSQLGLTKGSETLIQIITAMADGSYLQLSVDSSYNANQYPNTSGILIVDKANINRSNIQFTKSSGEVYNQAYHSNSGLSGWRLLVATDTITNFYKTIYTNIKSSMIDLFLPKGSYKDFDEDIDPNDLYPNTTWVRVEGVVRGGISNTEGSQYNGESGTVIGNDTEDIDFSHSHTLLNPGTVAKTSGDLVANGGNNTSSATLKKTLSHIQPTKLCYMWQRTA